MGLVLGLRARVLPAGKFPPLTTLEGKNSDCLAIIDVGTDPYNPSLVGSYSSDTYINGARGVAIDTSKGYAYVTESISDSLAIIAKGCGAGYFNEGDDCSSCPGAPAGSTSCLSDECGDHQWAYWVVADDSQTVVCIDCAYEAACDGTSTCLHNHEGYACGACKSDHFLLNEKCRKCPEKWGKFAWVFAGIFAAIVCFLIYRVTGFDSAGSMPIFTTLTISVTHFQVTSIYLSFSIEYPEFFARVAKWLIAVFSFDLPGLASPECSTGSFGYSERWWVATTIPFMLMVPFAIVWLVNAELSSSRSKAVHSIMVVMFISYVFTISTAMEAWVCHEYGQDGIYSLVAYPDITCDDSDQRWQG